MSRHRKQLARRWPLMALLLSAGASGGCFFFVDFILSNEQEIEVLVTTSDDGAPVADATVTMAAARRENPAHDSLSDDEYLDQHPHGVGATDAAGRAVIPLDSVTVCTSVGVHECNQAESQLIGATYLLRVQNSGFSEILTIDLNDGEWVSGDGVNVRVVSVGSAMPKPDDE